MGGGILISSLHAQRNDVANYTCWICLAGMVAADGVPSSDVREENEAAKALSLHGVNTELKEGSVVKFCFQLRLCWRKGRWEARCVMEASSAAEGSLSCNQETKPSVV